MLTKREWIILIGTLIVLISIILILSNFSPFTWMDGVSGTKMRDLLRIQNGLDLYYIYNNHFPTSLHDLEKFLQENKKNPEAKIPKDPKTQKDYLYAFYPDKKPTAYHLGAILENKHATILRNDADFNSQTAGYVNGFSGKDPVYDIHISK